MKEPSYNFALTQGAKVVLIAYRSFGGRPSMFSTFTYVQAGGILRSLGYRGDHPFFTLGDRGRRLGLGEPPLTSDI